LNKLFFFFHFGNFPFKIKNDNFFLLFCSPNIGEDPPLGVWDGDVKEEDGEIGELLGGGFVCSMKSSQSNNSLEILFLGSCFMMFG